MEVAEGAGRWTEKMGAQAAYPRIASRASSYDLTLLPQDELSELNLFTKEAVRALNEETEISDDGNGQLSLNPGLYVSPSLARKIAARSRNSCPPRCILRSRKSAPKEKRRISWCNPVVQDMQAPPEDPVIPDDDNDDAHYLHRAGTLSKHFPQPMRPCTTTYWTSKQSAPRKQRIVLATLLGIAVIATLAAAAIGTFGTEDVRLLIDVLCFMSGQLCPSWFLPVAFVLRRVLQAAVCLGFLVLQLALIAWLANGDGGSSVEKDVEEMTMHSVSDWSSQDQQNHLL